MIMAATDMKFGPEWLRALSDGGPNVQTQPSSFSAPSVTTPKYKLAEYRYGREEMLALYDRECKAPEELKEFPNIYVEKTQLPLAVIPMTEEEQRLWSRNVNSDVVLRIMGKSGGGHERERISERGGVSIRGGRSGGLNDRGRGRGRGGFYQRGAYEDDGDSPPDRREFRRNFERSTSVNDDAPPRDKRFDRSFARGVSSVDDTSLGLRKNNSRSSSVENWRTAGRGEDREGWRTASRPDNAWGRGGSWRSGERDIREHEYNNEHIQRNGPHRKLYSNYSKDKSELYADAEDDERRNSLPEWSLDDGPDSDAIVGTFDASGAFRESNLEDDELEEVADENDDGGDKLDEEWTNVGKNGKKIKDTQPLVNNRQKENSEVTKDANEKGNKMMENKERDDKMIDNEQKTNSVTATIVSQQIQHSAAPSSDPPSKTELQSVKALKGDRHSHNQVKSPHDDDGFAHLEKEAENMVAQWTAEDDQKDHPQLHDNSNNNLIVLPPHHEDAFKWFYRDPQGEIQGPFTPQEMYEWFTAGYFAMDLLVRRSCDEAFAHLGELFKMWERVPFSPHQGPQPPPLRNTKLLSSSSSSSSPPKISLTPIPLPSAPSQSSHPIHQHMIQQQIHQQQQKLLLNQHLDMQSQLRQLLAQLKKQEGFSDLSQQQQQEVLVQRYVAAKNMELQRQAMPSSIPQPRPNEDSHLPIDALSNLRLQRTPTRPIPIVSRGVPAPVTGIWDVNSGVVSVTAIEEMQRKEQERKELEEKRKLFEDEQKRRLEQEEYQRKMVEEQKRKYEELQKKLEEERNRNQELLRQQEEERRQREEDERIRIEDERRRLEEERRMMEEQRRRQEELIRLEEYARRQQQEDNERRRREADADKERQRQMQHEMEQQRLRQIQQLQQQETIKKMQDMQQRKAWTTAEHTQRTQTTALSLNEIQRIQEDKEREERELQRQIQLQHEQMQALFHAQQQQQQQQQQQKQQLTWANSYQQQSAPVKTLAEIQREEAEKVAKQKQIDQQTHVSSVVPNAGIWNNATSQLFGHSTPKLGQTPNSSTISNIGFWENDTRKVQTNRANDSALTQSNNKGNNHTVFPQKSNSRNKKDEEAVLKIFENQRRQKTDEFTNWCNDALSKYQSSVDIPTFIAFLKDVESPFEINDYVRSYLGDGKDAKEFAKQFIEKRSYFRNRAKKEATEELMWGPAPAITPSANKLSQSPSNQFQGGDCDSSGFIHAGKKKKKGKRVVDNSILGFTVQADPDRINVGEIEHIDD